ncbi:hypothetical protein [uncultured Methanobrevibacter sp.]|uniref:hypothetical protein n=1 Tax=uncultured Methanobrevibacter sp. TaxID=253161 RepID=UPI00260A262E|nr:hypothetical protein [uncultured Methanobrevibacter sp.]
MKRILVIFAVLLALCVCVSAVSADDSWSFNWSSSESSNSDGGAISLENNKLTMQGLKFTIPDGYKQNESAQKVGEPANDIGGAKYSCCGFLNGDKELYIKVFYFDDANTVFTNVDDSLEGTHNETVSQIQGRAFDDKYGDGTPTFQYVKDGKLVEINAPDQETIAAVIK